MTTVAQGSLRGEMCYEASGVEEVIEEETIAQKQKRYAEEDIKWGKEWDSYPAFFKGFIWGMVAGEDYKAAQRLTTPFCGDLPPDRDLTPRELSTRMEIIANYATESSWMK